MSMFTLMCSNAVHSADAITKDWGAHPGNSQKHYLHLMRDNLLSASQNVELSAVEKEAFRKAYCHLTNAINFC